MRKCLNCSKDISHLHHSKKYCSEECIYKHWVLKENEKNIDKEWPICKICGLKRKSLHNHIKKVHNITVSEYYKKFNCNSSEVYAQETLRKMSDNVKGGKNPGFNHCGKFSPVSKNFIKYSKLSDKEKEQQIKEVKNTIRNVKENEPWRKGNNNIEYFLHKGYSEEEAKVLLKDRQTTFSLKKCIQKHGEEKGRKVWKDRQEKWLSSYKKQNYSQISQDLFWKLYGSIKKDFNKIYFAQLHNSIKDESGKNYEKRIDIGDSFIKADFLVSDNNKIIEFDGDYWHGRKRGNQQRDKERDDKLIEAGYEVLHIKERDYKKEPLKIIEECKEFLYDRPTK
jgi:very-short-patch-repair endonuclease